MRWTLKSLGTQIASTLASAGGVAGAFLFVLFLEAVFLGESKQIVAYIEHMEPDIWVMQHGVSNMHMASSFVWDWKLDAVVEMDGVEKVTSILYVNTMVRAGDRDWFTYVVGLVEGDKRAGPWAMKSGSASPGPGEIVIPALFAESSGAGLGSSVSVADKKFTVVGLSLGTFSMANSVAFVSFGDLVNILSAGGTVSYGLVDLEPGSDAAAMARRIEAEVEKVSALPHPEFVRNDFNMAMRMGVDVVAFMRVIGSALAVAIIAFTALVQVSRRRRELAIAKALGVTNRSIYFSVVLQTVLITTAGYAVALALALGVAPMISLFVPEVTLLVSTGSLLRMGAVALVVAVIAAMVPAYMVNQVDPLTAFQG